MQVSKRLTVVGILLAGGSVALFAAKRPDPRKVAPVQAIPQAAIDRAEKDRPPVPVRIPQEVADQKVYASADLPLDGKPHYEAVVGDSHHSKIVTLGLPPPYAQKMGIGWFGTYPRSDWTRRVVAGRGRAAVIGSKRTYFVPGTKDEGATEGVIQRYLAVVPKAEATKIGTVSMALEDAHEDESRADASALARHLGECVRVARAMGAEKRNILAYPRRVQIGKMWCSADSTLILYVDQQSPASPPVVNFDSTYWTPNFTYGKLLVCTNRLEDVDLLRRQVIRVAAWLENRPSTP